jgi:hypothetical protein
LAARDESIGFNQAMVVGRAQAGGNVMGWYLLHDRSGAGDL